MLNNNKVKQIIKKKRIENKRIQKKIIAMTNMFIVLHNINYALFHIFNLKDDLHSLFQVVFVTFAHIQSNKTSILLSTNLTK